MTRPLILLVDDDPAVRAAITFALEVEGFEVESFASTEAVLAWGPDREITCAVIDHRLPGIDGLALLARLRARFGAVRAIIITTNASRHVRRRIARMDAILLEKPLLGGAVVETIRGIAPNPVSNDCG